MSKQTLIIYVSNLFERTEKTLLAEVPKENLDNLAKQGITGKYHLRKEPKNCFPEFFEKMGAKDFKMTELEVELAQAFSVYEMFKNPEAYDINFAKQKPVLLHQLFPKMKTRVWIQSQETLPFFHNLLNHPKDMVHVVSGPNVELLDSLSNHYLEKKDEVLGFVQLVAPTNHTQKVEFIKNLDWLVGKLLKADPKDNKCCVLLMGSFAPETKLPSTDKPKSHPNPEEKPYYHPKQSYTFFEWGRPVDEGVIDEFPVLGTLNWVSGISRKDDCEVFNEHELLAKNGFGSALIDRNIHEIAYRMGASKKYGA